MSKGIKVAGCCSVCHDEVFPVEEEYTEQTQSPGSPLIGLPRRLGPALDTAYRVMLVLTDGTVMPMTVCEDCLPDVNGNLKAIWEGVLEAMAFDWRNRAWYGGAPMSDEQLQKAAGDCLRIASMAPLGVQYSQKWTEINDGR